MKKVKTPVKKSVLVDIGISSLSLFVYRRFESKPAKPAQIDRFIRIPYERPDKDNLLSAFKQGLSGIEHDGSAACLIIPYDRIISRYIRVPSCNSSEIRRMVFLQAERLLPYSASEIAIGYNPVSSDKEGFTYVSLIVVPKEVLGMYFDTAREAGLSIDSVYPSIYGISGFWRPGHSLSGEEVLIAGADEPGDKNNNEPLRLEAAVLNKGKICFSRMVSLELSAGDWKHDLFRHIMDTQQLYLRHGSCGPIRKLYLWGELLRLDGCLSYLGEKMLIPVEPLAVPSSRVPVLSGGLKIESFPDSYFKPVGFMFEYPQESLSLLPQELKRSKELIIRFRNLRILGVVLAAAAFITALGFYKLLLNQRRGLDVINERLTEIKARSETIEPMARRLQLLKSQKVRTGFILDAWHAAHSALPSGVRLTEFAFNEARAEALSLKGLSKDRDRVFSYASSLQGFAVFSAGEVKVKRVTTKDVSGAELVDFEVVFLR